jgi:catechol 2,3-dioxygenase
MPSQIPQLRLRHMGMFVRDIDRMAAFYKEVLGFFETDRGPANGFYVVFLSRSPYAHHQVVLSTGRPESSGRTHAIQQISFMVDSLQDLRTMYSVVTSRDDVSDISPRNHGNAWSLYFRDPEENRIEIYLDTPWHMAQPHHIDLDLTLTDEEILKQTEAHVRAAPTFKPMPEYNREQAEMMRAAGIDART